MLACDTTEIGRVKCWISTQRLGQKEVLDREPGWFSVSGQQQQQQQLLDSISSPTGPHPPLRLARRPNWGHKGGGPSCGTCLWSFLSRVGSALPTLVNNEIEAPMFYLLTKSGTRSLPVLSRNKYEKKTQFAGVRTHRPKFRRFAWIPTRPPGRSGTVYLLLICRFNALLAL